MKKIIIILALVFVLVACRPAPKAFEVPVHSGTEGVVLKFMERAPPDTAYEKTKMPIYIELHNKGAEPTAIDYAIVFQEKYIVVDQPRGTVTIEGKSLYDPYGQKDLVQLSADVRSLGKAEQTKETPLSVHICYPYKTIATATVCVDTEPESTKPKVCKPGPVTLSGGQGGPVGVTNVETNMLAFEGVAYPDFEITIANFQGGTILNKVRTPDACRLTVSSGEDLYNIIRARAFLSDQELDCSPKLFGQRGRGAYLRWSQKSNKITCRLPEGMQRRGNFPSPLRVILDYGYTQHVTKNILIKKR